MVSKIEPDRYADTGFSIADNPADLNDRLFRQMMKKTGAERLIIGCQMAATARQLVWSGIPESLPRDKRNNLFLERFNGKDFGKPWPPILPMPSMPSQTAAPPKPASNMEKGFATP